MTQPRKMAPGDLRQGLKSQRKKSRCHLRGNVLQAATPISQRSQRRTEMPPAVSPKLIAMLITGLALVLIALAWAGLTRSEQSAEAANLKKMSALPIGLLELDQEKAQNQKLLRTMESLRSENTDKAFQLQGKENQLQETEKQLRQADQKLRDTLSKLGELQDKLRESQAQLAGKDEQVKELGAEIKQLQGQLDIVENIKRQREKEIKQLQQLAKGKPAAEPAKGVKLSDLKWPVYFSEKRALFSTGGQLKRLLERLDKGAKGEARSTAIIEAFELIATMRKILQRAADITDLNYSDACSFLDNLEGKLRSMKHQQ